MIGNSPSTGGPQIPWADPKEIRVAAPSPIHRVRTPVKRAESVEDKILRRPDVVDAGLTPASFQKMNEMLSSRNMGRAAEYPTSAFESKMNLESLAKHWGEFNLLIYRFIMESPHAHLRE